MKRFWLTCGCISAFLIGDAAMAISAGTVANDSARASVYTNSAGYSTAGSRGQKGIANAYIQNQRNTYFLVTQPDVDTACRRKIMNCLTDYCGDSTVVPGKTSSRCMYATETELYNYV